jgi:hypothetical protein
MNKKRGRPREWTAERLSNLYLAVELRIANRGGPREQVVSQVCREIAATLGLDEKEGDRLRERYYEARRAAQPTHDAVTAIKARMDDEDKDRLPGARLRDDRQWCRLLDRISPQPVKNLRRTKTKY